MVWLPVFHLADGEESAHLGNDRGETKQALGFGQAFANIRPT